MKVEILRDVKIRKYMMLSCFKKYVTTWWWWWCVCVCVCVYVCVTSDKE